MDDARRLAAKVAELEKAVRHLQTRADLGHSSIEEDRLDVFDEDGNAVVEVGLHDDGTYGVRGTNGGRVLADGAAEGSDFEPFIPSEAPAASPAITVTNTAEALIVVTEPVEQATVLTYQMSLDFDEDTGTGTWADLPDMPTRSTIYSVTTTPDGAALRSDVTYWLRVVAGNSVGDAPPSTPAEGVLDGSKVSDIVLASLTAGIVMAGRFESGNGYWDPDEGLVLPQPGGLVTRLSTDGVTPSQLAGEFIALFLTVDQGILTGLLDVIGRIRLASGVSDPTQPPVVVHGHPSTQLTYVGGDTLFDSWGLCDTPDGDRWVTVSNNTQTALKFHHFSKVGGADGTQDDATGANYLEWFEPRGGVTRVGDRYYVLGTKNVFENEWVLVFDESFALVDSFQIGSTANVPSIGTDGVNLLIAWVTAKDNLNVRTYTVDGTVVGTTNFGTPPGSAIAVRAIAGGTFDLGVERFFLSDKTGTIYCLDPATASRDETFDFLRASGTRGMWWDGSRFHTVDPNGRLRDYSAVREDQMVTAKYAWQEDGGGTTAASPATEHDWPARSFLTVEGRPVPTEGLRVALYAGPSEAECRHRITLNPGEVGHTFDTFVTPNMLTNSGFEAIPGAEYDANPDDALTRVESDEALFGEWYGRLTNTDGRAAPNLQTEDKTFAACAPGDVLTASVYARVNTGTAVEIRLDIQFFQADGTLVPVGASHLGDKTLLDSEWQRIITQGVVAPADTAEAQIRLVMVDSGVLGEAIDLDGLQLEKGPIPSPYQPAEASVLAPTTSTLSGAITPGEFTSAAVDALGDPLTELLGDGYARVLGTDIWHEVGTTGEPAYQNGWSPLSGETLEFTKTPTGEVHIRGRVVPGSQGTVFTLPDGYRPSGPVRGFRCNAQGASNTNVVSIETDGSVECFTFGTASWVDITCSFLAR